MSIWHFCEIIIQIYSFYMWFGDNFFFFQVKHSKSHLSWIWLPLHVRLEFKDCFNKGFRFFKIRRFCCQRKILVLNLLHQLSKAMEIQFLFQEFLKIQECFFYFWRTDWKSHKSQSNILQVTGLCWIIFDDLQSNAGRSTGVPVRSCNGHTRKNGTLISNCTYQSGPNIFAECREYFWSVNRLVKQRSGSGGHLLQYEEHSGSHPRSFPGLFHMCSGTSPEQFRSRPELAGSWRSRQDVISRLICDFLSY